MCQHLVLFLLTLHVSTPVNYLVSHKEPVFQHVKPVFTHYAYFIKDFKYIYFICCITAINYDLKNAFP
jgi:hypothetical protein